jgi:hypothetical protein
VEINGAPVWTQDSKSKVTAMTARDEAGFQIPWSPGDRIRVAGQTKSWIPPWRWSDLAWVEDTTPLSLRMLGRNTSLKNLALGTEDESKRGPMVRFRVDGFTEPDWLLLHDWIYPGEQW